MALLDMRLLLVTKVVETLLSSLPGDSIHIHGSHSGGAVKDAGNFLKRRSLLCGVSNVLVLRLDVYIP
jgi:hypothetical protein